jgi:hypothetical protein
MAKEREQRLVIADRMYLVNRMNFVPKFCGLFVVEFVLLFGFIVVIQLMKEELTNRQLIIAWLIFAVITWTFLKKCLAFFRTFQRMVTESKVEMSAIASKDHEFILVQALTFGVGAAAIYSRNAGSGSHIVYFAYVMLLQSLALLIDGIMTYFFNREPTEDEIDAEIEARKNRAKKD